MRLQLLGGAKILLIQEDWCALNSWNHLTDALFRSENFLMELSEESKRREIFFTTSSTNIWPENTSVKVYPGRESRPWRKTFFCGLTIIDRFLLQIDPDSALKNYLRTLCLNFSATADLWFICAGPFSHHSPICRLFTFDYKSHIFGGFAIYLARMWVQNADIRLASKQTEGARKNEMKSENMWNPRTIGRPFLYVVGWYLAGIAFQIQFRSDIGNLFILLLLQEFPRYSRKYVFLGQWANRFGHHHHR